MEALIFHGCKSCPQYFLRKDSREEVGLRVLAETYRQSFLIGKTPDPFNNMNTDSIF